MLYKNGPDFYHSSYSVKLIPVPADSIDGNQLDCTTLSGLSRITEGACKVSDRSKDFFLTSKDAVV